MDRDADADVDAAWGKREAGEGDRAEDADEDVEMDQYEGVDLPKWACCRMIRAQLTSTVHLSHRFRTRGGRDGTCVAFWVSLLSGLCLISV